MHEDEVPAPSSSSLKRRAPDIALAQRHMHTGHDISADNHLLVFTDKSLRHESESESGPLQFEDNEKISFLGEKVGSGMEHGTKGTTTDASV